jgi:alkylation response protein AidB-like acyl-CoA dehydrogenase
MDLAYSPEDQAFRDEVRAFVRASVPRDIVEKSLAYRRLGRDDYMRWQDILAAKGWLAGHWPREYGGCGWNPVQVHIFDEETAAAGAPRLIPFGLQMVAHVIMAFGSDWQKQHYLTRIRENKDWWCQGYSEPGAGSDLAALRTKAELVKDPAVRDGGMEYVVNGQKIWTTLAQHADMMFCLVRTSQGARKQEGISFLLVDMHSPGITVKPLIVLDGAHEVNEVFLDDVRVPAKNLVGEEGKGWTYAKYLLGFERTGIAGVGTSKRDLALVRALARRTPAGVGVVYDEPRFRERLAQLETDLLALEMTVLRVLAMRGKSPGAEASILKVRGSELQQEISELRMLVAGPLADEEAGRYLQWRKSTIYGGSNEVQRNILAQAVLGL